MAENRITPEQLENIAIRVLDSIPQGKPDDNGNRLFKYLCTFKHSLSGGKYEKTSIELYGMQDIAPGYYLPAPSVKWLTVINKDGDNEKRSSGMKPIFKIGPFLHS